MELESQWRIVKGNYISKIYVGNGPDSYKFLLIVRNIYISVPDDLSMLYIYEIKASEVSV